MLSPIAIAKKLFNLAKPLYMRVETYLPATCFFGGLSFDILTLGRIDHWFNLVQQGAAIVVVGYLVILEVLDPLYPKAVPRLLRKVWKWRALLIHFFFGMLLSMYSIFYFKSASAWSFVAFFLPLAALLIINEFERFQKIGVPLRVFMLSLCLSSYLTYLIPTLWGSMGVLPFILSCLLAALAFVWVIRMLRRHNPPRGYIARRLALPAFGVQALFLALYLANVLPPVPLSSQYMGIFHEVRRQDTTYHLTYTRPWFHFWKRDERPFLAAEGDPVYCYFRLFAPNRFSDHIYVRWAYLTKKGWKSTDAIPVKIFGGRGLGFRGFAYKENYTPGRWRVILQTKEAREISRIAFTIKARDPDRQFVLRNRRD